MKEVIDEKVLEISHHSRGFSSAFDRDPKTEVRNVNGIFFNAHLGAWGSS